MPATRVIGPPVTAAELTAALAADIGDAEPCAADDIGDALRAGVRAGAEVVVVATAEHIEDGVFRAALDEVEEFLASDRPLARRPRISFVVGRDVASTRALIRRMRPSDASASAATPARFAVYAPGSHGGARVDELDRATARVTRRELDRPALLESLAQGCPDVVAYQAHGSDACAKAGAGVVLCGLHGTAATGDGPGRLACGHGHACPRGTDPVPLSDLSASVMFLAACNAIRMAGSSHRPEFNLALSFVDGAGSGFAGSFSAVRGSDALTSCFLAAMAAGRSLETATFLVNALCACGRFEQPSFVAIGGLAGGELETPAAALPPGGVVALERATTMVEILVTDRDLVELARAGRLGWEVDDVESDERMRWFQRVESTGAATDESNDGANRGSDGGGGVLRVFVYRFPTPFARVRMTAVDVVTTREDVRGALRGVDRWLEVWRLGGAHEREPEAYALIQEAATEHASAAARELATVGFDGAAIAQLRARADAVADVAMSAGSLYLADSLNALAGPFYLTNVVASEYAFERALPGRCPWCDEPSRRKTHRHPIHGDARVADVCSRCGIVTDLLEDGAVGAITIDAPTVVAAGSVLRASVVIHLERYVRRLSAVAHLSRHLLDPLRPLLDVDRVEAGGGRRLVLPVDAALPASLLPHQYHLRVLVATADGASFAQRPIWVGPAPMGAS